MQLITGVDMGNGMDTVVAGDFLSDLHLYTLIIPTIPIILNVREYAVTA
jgi:hypothetical protein